MEVIFQYANNIYYFKKYIKSINSNNLYTINIYTRDCVRWSNVWKVLLVKYCSSDTGLEKEK